MKVMSTAKRRACIADDAFELWCSKEDPQQEELHPQQIVRKNTKADLENLDYRKPPEGQEASPEEEQGDPSERRGPDLRAGKHA